MNSSLVITLRWRSLALAVICALLVFSLHPVLPSAQALSSSVVISQVYGGGGNFGAPYNSDFIELFNRGTSSVPLTGWSVQYASATGTGNFGATTGQITPLSGSLAPGQYLLVKESSGASGVPLPIADVTDSTPINMSATGGKVALVNTTTPLGCNGGSTPCSSGALALIVDLVGYDGANFFETAPAPAASNTTAVIRLGGGCTETDNNGADFSAGAPAPRNTASPLHSCTGPTGVGAANPATLFAGQSTLLTVAVTPGSLPTSTGLAVTGDLSSIGGSSIQIFFDDATQGDATAGDNVFSFQATAATGTTPGLKTLPVVIADAQSRTAAASIALTIDAPPTLIHDIQGASHRSPKVGQAVAGVAGVVTARRSNGFYMQDPNPDADEATSEGIFVFTSSAPAVNVGQAVVVSGFVAEFRPGGASSTNLTITEITSPVITVVSSGNPLPAPIVIGTGGRIPPGTVIEDDAAGDVETSGVFDPASDGIDFYESLEGMLVQVNDAVATGRTVVFGSGASRNREISVIGDNGAHAGVRTGRGGIVIGSADFNPERIILNDLIIGGPLLPAVDVGDRFPGAILGVMDYSFGNFKLEVAQLPALVSNGLTREIADPAGLNELAVATFNVENLDPTDPPEKFGELAELIVDHLRSPDIVAVEEIQDNNGATNNGVVDASTTFSMMIAAIQAAGGPAYDYRQIDPVDGQDGGQPGGNIRQGFLFRTDRGLTFVDRPGGDATTGISVVAGLDGAELSASPGRIDPTNGAFTTSRKPLAGEFMFSGHHLFVIANHFNSKGGDQPLYGHFQPPVRSSEAQRHLQAQVENDFVDALLAVDPNADVVVLGDLNDFEFSDTLTVLKGGVLHTLMDSLPQAERYSYVFDGNSQAIDHTLLSSHLFDARPFTYDVVHVNSEFAVQASDHEPQVTHLLLNDPPGADAGGPYSVDEGSSVTLNAAGADLEGGALSYAWDLDNNGTFETPGQSVSFSGVDGPAVLTVAVQVTDNGGLSSVASAEVTVENLAPVLGAISGPAGPVAAGTAVNVSAPFTDAGVLDTHTAVWDWGDGSTSGTVTEVNGSGIADGTHAYSAAGIYTVVLTLTDKDGATAQATFQYVVVYDAQAGSATGGGWISASGGKANFGFTAGYDKNAALGGQVEFNLKPLDLNFHSAGFDWLVVSGNRMTLVGAGTLNGGGDYGFLLAAVDGGNTDQFRMKIWDKATGVVIFDNQPGAADDLAPGQTIGGGNITIHN